jgi:hypothetical protein
VPRLPLLLIASLIAALLVACSSSEAEDTSADASSESDDTEVGTNSAASSEVMGPYGDMASWMCHPALDDTDNQCLGGLDLTVVHPDGSTEIVAHQPAENPDIDCFYLYSTISQDPQAHSDLVPSDLEEGRALQNQAARLSSVCEVWAPVYRSATIGGPGELVPGAGGVIVGQEDGVVVDGGQTAVEEQPEVIPDPPYQDALAAWNTYLAQSEPGRGVVLVGSSQGADLLHRIIAQEIDDNDARRARLVSALLLGSRVSVPHGQTLGGDFDNVPLCQTESQIGCVVSFESYRSTEPPEAFVPAGESLEGVSVGSCVNPAAPSGGAADLDAVFSTSTDRGWWPSWSPWSEPDASAEITTAFYSVPGLVSGECVSEGGNSYLSVTVNSDAIDPRADDIEGDFPGRGLHLIDANLTMGDQVTLVRAQAEEFARSGSNTE